jgi:hypothetical protein
MFGFAYQDSKIPKGDVFEYGLFAIGSVGLGHSAPIAVRRWERGWKPSRELRFGEPQIKPSSDGRFMRVRWSLPREDLDAHLVRYLHVDVVDPRGTRKQLVRVQRSEMERDQGVDVSLQGLTGPGVYSLNAVAINYFDLESTPSPTARYEFAKYRGSLKPAP